MSSFAEIESAIEQLSPNEFRALHQWREERAIDRTGRKWSPEELAEGARRMLEESDPARSDAIWEELVKGFYGRADA